jgi:FMN-dependent NADH-azoreductase
MSRVLMLLCSPFGPDSQGAVFARRLAGHLAPGAETIVRDLNLPITPVNRHYAHAITSGAAMDDASYATSEELVSELERSDLLLIATPMHNFTVPAALKLWIDQVLRMGRSFEATREGKRGLMADRPTYVVVTSGGFYEGERARQPDFLTPYLKVVLATLGIHQVEFIHLQAVSGRPGAAPELMDQAWDKLGLATPSISL